MAGARALGEWRGHGTKALSFRGSQGASRAAPGKSGLHARGEGERVMSLVPDAGLVVET